MPTRKLYECVKQKAYSFMFIGCVVTFNVENMRYGSSPLITILFENKIYKFCDPDWDVVNKQLDTLYFVIKEKHDRETNANHR